MKIIGYLVIGFLVFYATNLVSIYFAHAIGAGPGEIGVVVSAISILCALLVVCTIVIVEAIHSIGNK